MTDSPLLAAEPRTGNLEVDRLVHRFGGRTVLDEVSFSLSPGEVACLVGENGAGKSTIVNILGGVLRPADGAIKLAGKPVSFGSPADALEAGIGIVYQDLALCDNLSIAENIFLAREKTNRAPLVRALARRAMEAEASELLHSLTAAAWDVQQKTSRLSGGQRQSVAIARAMLLDPGIVILDEPTAALSVRHVDEVHRLIKGLASRGRAVLLILHDLNEVAELADKVIALRHGRVIGVSARGAYTVDQLLLAINGVGHLPGQDKDLPDDL
ncbi:MAG TPA: ATP-binding cassette domain-containing protein [Trebonia sp.]